MDYFKKVTLQHNDIIIDRYKHYITKASELHAMTVPASEWKWLNDRVIDDISNITGKHHYIKNAIIFFQPGYHTRGIHVDGYRTDITDFSWALNIPLENCQQAEMGWFSGEYSMEIKSNKIGLPSLDLNWHSTPCMAASTILDSPTIVKVDVPHTVINSSLMPRCLLSIRFSPELF